MKVTLSRFLKEDLLTIDLLIRLSITTLEESSKIIATFIRVILVEETIYKISIDSKMSID